MQKLLVLTAVLMVGVGSAIKAVTPAPLASKPAPPAVTIPLEDIAAMP